MGSAPDDSRGVRATEVRTATVIAGLLLWVCMGCGTPGGYLIDRGRDATDVVTATVGVGGGAKARVGPFTPGLVFHLNYAGLQDGDGFASFSEEWAGFHGIDVLILGCGGVLGNASELSKARKKYHEAWCLFGIALPASWECNPPIYGPAYFTQVEVVAGLGGTVKLGVNPGELLDFLLGWTTLDIFSDDLERTKRQ